MICEHWREAVEDKDGVFLRAGYRCLKLNKEVNCFADAKYCEGDVNEGIDMETTYTGKYVHDELCELRDWLEKYATLGDSFPGATFNRGALERWIEIITVITTVIKCVLSNIGVVLK